MQELNAGLSRREVLKTAALATGVLLVPGFPGAARAEEKLKLPDLPWDAGALAPTISAKTLEFHHGKHHKGYIENVNKFVEAKKLEGATLEDLVKDAAKKTDDPGLFNNAAQAWNHGFYWKSLAPGAAKKEPAGKLAEHIKTYGGMEKLKKDLAAAATGQFGSGWAWLVLDGDKLAVEKTANADTPLVHGKKPLLTIDVWEHAYYLDYQNKRADYVNGVLENLINWEFAAANLG
jgi:Fe-Mn family superoxide dismutase